MLVSLENLPSVLENLKYKTHLALDTETYGKAWNDAMFSLIIGTVDRQFYFNFLDTPDHLGNCAPQEYILDKRETLKILEPILYQDTLWFMHNAKFDLRRLDIDGVDPLKMLAIHDTEVTERIIRNDRLNYSLDSVAKEYDLAKDDAVKAYISKHKLYSMVDIPGKKTKEKDMYFHLVPFDIMSKYGCTDVSITYEIGQRQLDAIGI